MKNWDSRFANGRQDDFYLVVGHGYWHAMAEEWSEWILGDGKYCVLNQTFLLRVTVSSMLNVQTCFDTERKIFSRSI